jgi:Domain of unknown function (DUF4178)
MVVRTDLDVELIGKEAQLQEDSSPFAIGTQGRYGGVAFGLIGRTVMAWDDALFDDQRSGWLAEAQGQLMMFFETDAAVANAALSAQGGAMQLEVGSLLTLDRQTYSVTDIKDARCVGCQGELPGRIRTGEQSRGIDLTAPPDYCATIEQGNQSTHLFLGRFVQFEDCRFSQLRDVPGWS